MRTIGVLLSGLLTGLISLLIVTGAVSLALSEGFTVAPPIPEPPAATLPVQTGQLAPTSSVPTASAPTARPSATSFIATSCPIPAGWHEAVLQPGDTLENLAAGHGVSAQTIAAANCLLAEQLPPGSIIFLPPVTPTLAPPPPPTEPYIPCGPPYGWMRYIVRPGDTLFKLSLELHVSVIQLQWANCLGGSTLIRAGDMLYVPFLPPPRPPEPSPATAVPTTPTDEPDVVTGTPDPDATVEPTEEETLPPEETEPPDETEPPEETEPPQETEPPDVILPTEEIEPPVDPGAGI